MNELGVNRAGGSEWLSMVELGDDHCATCFADGIQVITGCTFGKGNIRNLNYGKRGMSLINKKRGKGVRIAVRAEVMQADQTTVFFQNCRMKGVSSTQVPLEVVEPLVDRFISAPEEQRWQTGETFDHVYQEPPHSFNLFICEESGEMVVKVYGHLKNGKKVCIPCAEKE